jgi:quercetin dioxygenase-like cupin family protein
MKIVRTDMVPKESRVSPMFTGQVTMQTLLPESSEFIVNIVNFGKGVRNKFHSHDYEQILIVTGGRGIVATEGEKQVVSEGDVILFPPGEKHWHGATEDSNFSHIFVTNTQTKTKNLED